MIIMTAYHRSVHLKVCIRKSISFLYFLLLIRREGAMVNLMIQPLGMLGESESADRGLGRRKYFDFEH